MHGMNPLTELIKSAKKYLFCSFSMQINCYYSTKLIGTPRVNFNLDFEK
jgi:hypothetical protein